MTDINIKIPSYEEIYQFAFLVSNGWVFDHYQGKWKKPGKLTKIFDRKTDREVETEWWDTGNAYWEAVEDKEKNQ